MATARMDEETRHILATVARLTDDVLHPAERALDALAAPDELPTHPSYVDALNSAREVGIHLATLPEKYGGLGVGWRVGLAASQRVATGAPGFAAQLLADGLLASIVSEVATEEELSSGPLMGLLAGDGASPAPLAFAIVQTTDDPSGAIRLSRGAISYKAGSRRPRRDEAAEVVLDDSRLRLRDLRLPRIANGDRASHLLLLLGDATGGVGTYLIPLDADGTIRERATPRMGMRAHVHADLVLRDVTLPAVPTFDAARSAVLLEKLLTANALAMVAVSLGVSTNAYEYGSDYARARIQGGKPIVEHPSVARHIWQAASSIDTVRLALDQAIDGLDGLPDLLRALHLRTAAAEMVERVTVDMLELLGGYGVTTEYQAEKLYRDARVLGVSNGYVEGPSVYSPVSLL